MRVSHETIYRTLFVQSRGALRKELTNCLRTGRTQRRPQVRSEQSGAGRLQNMILISDRPPEIEDRAVPGHWEGDLIIGKGGRSAIGVLVERSSRYVVLLHLPHGRSAEDVRAALTRQICKLPAELRRTLTWDQGKEARTVHDGYEHNCLLLRPAQRVAKRQQREHERSAEIVLPEQT
jgi:IS30 family transposase